MTSVLSSDDSNSSTSISDSASSASLGEDSGPEDDTLYVPRQYEQISKAEELYTKTYDIVCVNTRKGYWGDKKLPKKSKKAPGLSRANTNYRKRDRDRKKGVWRGGRPFSRFYPRFYGRVSDMADDEAMTRTKWAVKMSREQQERQKAYEEREARRQRARDREKRMEERRKQMEEQRKKSEAEAEERRVAPIIRRKQWNLVEHRSIKKNDPEWKITRNDKLEETAKRHASLLAHLESRDKKAAYLAKILSEVTIPEPKILEEDKEDKKPIDEMAEMIIADSSDEEEQEKEREKDRVKEIEKAKMKKREREELEAKEKAKNEKLVNSILRHLPIDELEDVVHDLSDKEFVKDSIATEETLLASLTRTLNTARKKLLAGTGETQLDSSFAIKAFDAKGYAQDFLKVKPLDDSEKRLPLIPFETTDWTDNLKHDTCSITPCRELFDSAFDIFTSGFFRGVNLAGGIFAGGAVSACLQPLNKEYLERFAQYRTVRRVVRKIDLPQYILDRVLHFTDLEDDILNGFRGDLARRYQTNTFTKSDIDIFFAGETLLEAEKKMRRLCSNIKRRFKELNVEYVLARTANAITFYPAGEYRNIQLIISTLRTLDDFLLFCDLDCTSCTYDGRDVIMSPRSVRAYNKRYNIVAPAQLNSDVSRSRLVKYSSRGFSTLVFDIRKHDAKHDEEIASVKNQFDHMQNLLHRARSRMLGDYNSAERHCFYEGTTKEEMMEYFMNKGIPCGQKLKHVWCPMTLEEEAKATREAAERGGYSSGRGGRGGGRGRPRRREYGEGQSFGGGYGRGDRPSFGRGYRDTYDDETQEVPGGLGEWEAEIRSKLKDLPKTAPVMRWKWLDTLKSRDVDHLLPRCYMCRKRSIPDFQPGQLGLALCVNCTKKNKQMMDQWDEVKNLESSVALVTGARIKIGYYIALRLLRSGATVIAVTRFPHDAALRYSKEHDFNSWKSKLHIYGVDLRHLGSVNEFIAHVMLRYKRIDMLINNAAQTKRRPRAYYFEVVARERKLMAGELSEKFLVKDCKSDPYLMLEYNVSPNSAIVAPKNMYDNSLVPGGMALDSTLPKSAALTQVQLHPMDGPERDDAMFPPGKVDEHDEPLDTRSSTTWNQKIDQIDPVELLEVQIVNSTVPFMFISSFTPLLKEAAATSHRKRAFVVNVTAVEGMFSYNKRNGGHPHTNMAKAALNMLTKSIGDTFADSNIFTTAVDTGWCTEMRFVPMSQRNDKGVPINPVPLSDKDGAARVLYPIYLGLTSAAPPPHGVLYHDFEVVPWN